MLSHTMLSRSNPNLHRGLASLLLILLLGLPGRAEALFDITFFDILVVDEGGGSFTFESQVEGTGLANGTVTPSGTGSSNFSTSETPTGLDFFLNFVSETALFTAFPDGVLYTFDINGTGGENANFSILLNLPAVPTGRPTITSPTPDGATGVALDVALTWTCASCAGDEIDAYLVHLATDADVVKDTGPVAGGNLAHPSLDPATDYQFEVELVNRTAGSLDLSTTDDDDGTTGYAFARSSLASNAFTTVPEPSTALLLGLGLVGIAAGRRRRATR